MSDLVTRKLHAAFRRFQGRDFAGAERRVGEILRDEPLRQALARFNTGDLAGAVWL